MKSKITMLIFKVLAEYDTRTSLFFHLDRFSYLHELMVFLLSLCDRKSPQVSGTLLSILTDLNNAIVWMVSTCSLISKSSSPFTNPLEIVPSVTITISITVTFMFHCYFSSLARSWYLCLFSLFFIFILWSSGKAKSTIYYYIYSFRAFHISVN